jgi:hypothetical protein
MGATVNRIDGLWVPQTLSRREEAWKTAEILLVRRRRAARSTLAGSVTH